MFSNCWTFDEIGEYKYSNLDTRRLVANSTNKIEALGLGTIKLGGDYMATATVSIPEQKRDILKIIASIEKREMKEILDELIDEYIERHKETLDILSKPEWVDIIEKGKEEISKGIKGKSLDELED